MRILIDILHPAHVHFFRNFYAEMTARGHQVHVTARAKDRSLELLEHYEIPYEHISDQSAGTAGLAIEMARRTLKLLRIMGEFRADAATGIMGPSIALAGTLRRVPAVVFYDTEFAWQTNWFAYPLAHSVCTPDCYQGQVRGTHIKYPGYHELAYLHPTRFVPDRSRLEAFGLDPDEPYSVVRFVSWQAVHDRNERGITPGQKRALVEALGAHGRVVVSSESPLPSDLAAFEIQGPFADVHHLLAFAQIVVGESATMSSEAAVLGVPAVMIAKTGRGYTDEQDSRYGLVHNFTEDQYELAIGAIERLCAEPPREATQLSRERLLADKIDVTAWMVNYFERSFPT